MLALPTTDWRETPFTTAQALAEAPAKAQWVEQEGVDHVFTHFSLALRVFEARVDTADPAWAWTPLAQARAAVPSLFAKALR